MRWVVLCLVLGGCKLIFQADPGGPAGDDDDTVPIDGEKLGDPSVAFEMIPVVLANDTINLTVSTNGDAVLNLRVSSSDGAFVNSNDPRELVTQVPAGPQQVTIPWRAASSPTTIRLNADVSYDPAFSAPVSANATFDVLQAFGHYIINNGQAVPLPTNRMYAARVTTMGTNRLVGLGLQVVGQPNTQLKLALYNDDGQITPGPANRISHTNAIDLPATGGRVEPAVLQQTVLPGGVYWVAVIADKDITVIGNLVGDQPQGRSANGAFASGLPSQWPLQSPADNHTMGIYAIFGPTQ